MSASWLIILLSQFFLMNRLNSFTKWFARNESSWIGFFKLGLGGKDSWINSQNWTFLTQKWSMKPGLIMILGSDSELERAEHLTSDSLKWTCWISSLIELNDLFVTWVNPIASFIKLQLADSMVRSERVMNQCSNNLTKWQSRELECVEDLTSKLRIYILFIVTKSYFGYVYVLNLKA